MRASGENAKLKQPGEGAAGQREPTETRPHYYFDTKTAQRVAANARRIDAER